VHLRPFAMPRTTLPTIICVGLCEGKNFRAHSKKYKGDPTYEYVAVWRITPIMAIQQHRMTVLRRPRYHLKGAMKPRPITPPSRIPEAIKLIYRESVGLPIAFKK
jgi:hypothetical protein